jgi:aspartate aminotransferase
MTPLDLSANLALNEEVDRRRAAGTPTVHLGFGESRLPLIEALRGAVLAGAQDNAYGPVAGGAGVRRAVAGYFGRRDLPTSGSQIVVGPGSKPLLMAVQMAVPGDVVLPVPAWNTYAPQARLAGKRVLGVPIPADCGGVPDPALLPARLREARARGADPRIMIVTTPDNPTGTIAPAALIDELCAIAEAEDLLIVSDEIYRDLVHDQAAEIHSPASVAPERTIVTTGLSKSLALGGWRIGAARFPDRPPGRDIRQDVLAVASEMWTVLARPMQRVAEYAFEEPAELRAYLTACRALHGAVARAVHEIVLAVGATCRPPTGGFYLYPDLEPLRDRLARRGVVDSASLQRRMADKHGLVVLAGHLLGDEPTALRFKMATSMLYGDTVDQQWAALSSSDPVRLPHVRQVLDLIGEGLMDLCVR